MTTNRLRRLAASLLAASSILVAGAAMAQDACKPGGTLRMARDMTARALVPWDSEGNGSIFVQVQMYDRLVEQMPGTIDLQPGLAESWDISADNLTYTFHLRQGVKFSNGDPVTAEDVKFSLDRMINKDVQVGWNFLMGHIAGFEVVDDKTVAMKMNSVDASVLYTLAIPAGGIISKKAYEALGEEGFRAAPVGSGPFMLAEFKADEGVKLVRNPNYWREGKPYLDGVDFEKIQDDNARMLKIQSGEDDVAQTVPFGVAKQIDALDGITVLSEPYMVMDSIWLNNEAAPLNEKAVRQALNYAAPKEIINDVVFDGYGTIQNHMIALNRFWDSTVPAYPYDIEKAKELLASSSVPNGFNLPMLVGSGDTASLQTAEILQAEYAKIGVTVDIQVLDNAAINDAYWSGNYLAKTWGPSSISSDVPDDSEQAAIMLSYSDEWKGFGTRYKSDKAIELVAAGVATTDEAERKKIYNELQRVAMEDAPQVALIFSPTMTAVSDKLQNFQTLTSGWWRLEDVCFK